MFGIDDAIGLGLGAIGLGMQIFGGSEQSKISKEMAEVSKDQAMHEQNINDLKMQQMELEGRRSQIETYRNIQRARALGVASAVNQGAQSGSGMKGGQAQVTNQGLFNLQGIDFGLSIGRGVNKENQFISQDKMKLADLGADMSSAQGLASLGGSLMKAGPIFGQFGASLGNMSLFPGVQLPGMK
jgi:hypothetical protein